ncbi:MAG: UDP-N-acetylglucosamine 2-epimerase (non-hydrolyzing) [Chloroflexi bacterium]|nr:UDP-N-acetylglucosamine 2-epimerase (non-hydrolyzing) [Chloroflexota bacterium]
MRPIKVLSIFGTRPEAVKMAPVVQRLAQTPGVDALVCVTAQHRQMLDQVLDLFQIKPDVDLDLMRPDQSLAQMTAAVFTHLDPVLARLRPDWVLVQGDTTTVMAAALLAYYHRVRVGHVEAGLRTGDKWQPFPEEINRRVAGVVADLHFAPTQWSADNLLREGVPTGRVIITGNTVIDALQSVASLPLTADTEALFARLGLPPAADPAAPLVLITAHRRENFGEPFEHIFSALRRLAERYPRANFVYPVHLNPNVQEPARRILSGLPNFHLLDPLDYFPMVQLMKRARLLLTDSGGLQEEAPGLGVPVLVLRQVTERPEGVEAGTVRLVGSDPQLILAEASRLLDDPQAHAAMARAVNPYGDGRAAERIVKKITQVQNPS